MNKNTAIIAMVLIAVVALAGGFFGGMQYQKGQTPARTFGAGGFAGRGVNGAGGTGRFGANGGRVAGQVLSISGNSMTVKMPDGSSKIVILSGSTQYMKASSGAQSDVTQGENVAVNGTANSDGSVTAQSVSIVPQGMNLFGGRPQSSAQPAQQGNGG